MTSQAAAAFTMTGVAEYDEVAQATKYTFTATPLPGAPCGQVTGIALAVPPGLGSAPGPVDTCEIGLRSALQWRGSSGFTVCAGHVVAGGCFCVVLVLQHTGAHLPQQATIPGRVGVGQFCRSRFAVGDGVNTMFSGPAGACVLIVSGTTCCAAGVMQ